MLHHPLNDQAVEFMAHALRFYMQCLPTDGAFAIVDAKGTPLLQFTSRQSRTGSGEFALGLARRVIETRRATNVKDESRGTYPIPGGLPIIGSDGSLLGAVGLCDTVDPQCDPLVHLTIQAAGFRVHYGPVA